MFSKSARRIGNIYVAPTELMAFLATHRYKDIAPTELDSWRVSRSQRTSRSSSLPLPNHSKLFQARRANKRGWLSFSVINAGPDRGQIYSRNCELAPRRGQ